MWLLQKKLIGLCLSVFCWSMVAMQKCVQQKPPVIFDVTALIKQDINARKRVLAAQLYKRYIWGISELRLEGALIRTFGEPLFRERSARLKFFEFLNKVPVVEHYPDTTFEGDVLPPIMAMWALGKLSAEKAMQQVRAFIDAQNYSEDDKAFYRALVYTSFDPEVMESTCYVDEKAVGVVDEFRKHGCPTYLVGHCDLASYDSLRRKGTEFLAKFNRVAFSHQCAVMPEKFDDSFWLHELGLADGSERSPEYLYVDDWMAPGVKGDVPPHYASTSSAVKRILAQTEP